MEHLKEELEVILDSLREFLINKDQNKPLEELHEIIRNLRISLHEFVINHYMPLSLQEGETFQSALADQLVNLCMEMNDGDEKDPYHDYCIEEIMACFSWAQQIKEEVPHDLITQKVLAVDIPILRPFDYGVKQSKKAPTLRKK